MANAYASATALLGCLDYATDVLDGTTAAGQWVRAACQRFLDDMSNAEDLGIYWDEAAAQHAIAFFSNLRHSKGEWANAVFTLAPWQVFIIGNLFGWKNVDDETRRFRTAYVEVARKNGKSTFAAGIGLYLLVADGEPGAEVYSAATKLDQAKIVHSEAVRMRDQSPALAARVKKTRENLHILQTASKYEPLGADSKTMDGLNIHGAIIDELHAHRNRSTYDVIETATGARRQPLIFAITTAGYDRNSVCYEHHQYAERLLERITEDETYFAFIAGIDPGDDWLDESVWFKANPNLNVSVKLKDLQRKAKKAKEIPAAQNAFRRLHLNEWTEQDTRWLDMEVWRDNPSDPIDEDALRGRECFSGLDLASTTDVAALVHVFPPTEADPRWVVLPRFFVPEGNVERRALKDRVPYDAWIREGWIIGTPGNVIDYRRIKDVIFEDAATFRVREVAFDRWNATQLIVEIMEEGIEAVGYGQGFASMAAPCREVEGILAARALAHGGNPVLAWMAANVTAEQDPAGNRKPSRARSAEKIDGIVALLMGLGRAIVVGSDTASRYDEEGIDFV